MDLSSEELDLLPSDEEVRLYNERGYYVSQKIFSDDEIDSAVYGSERFYAGERDFFLHGIIKPFEGWRPEDGQVLRINDYVSLQNREISLLVRKPLLGAIASRLSGNATIRLWHDQMIYKPEVGSGGTGIGWHTDRSYWKTCTQQDMLTAWIPFSDCDEPMGTLCFIEGSHKWAIDDDLKGFSSKELTWPEGGLPTEKSSVRVSMKLNKGQVTFHHCATIHGSDSNRSNKPRLSISVHLQTIENRYQKDTADKGIWHRNDVLCRTLNGQPDYSDPDICPVLWNGMAGSENISFSN